MNDALVLFERVGPAALLRLNRPDKRNALSRSLVAILARRIEEAVAVSDVRSIIVTSTGPAFCAGLDLDELAETAALPNAREQMQEDSRKLADLYRALATCPKPTVAAVNGPAVAGGAGLVTACDLAIATPRAKFGYPEVRRGITPAIITPMLLRVVSARTARQMLLTGELIAAAEAARLGIYNCVVAEEMFEQRLEETVAALAKGAPGTLTQTKRWIDRCTTGEALWFDSADASAAARFSDECVEGLAAFREKRDPRWVHKGIE